MTSPPTGRDSLHRRLPSMPKTKPLAKSTYDVGATFQITRPSSTHPFIEILQIKLLQPGHVGDNRTSQSFVAHVEDGPRRFKGMNVFIKVYDPLYINPDHLKTICTSVPCAF